MTNVSVVEEALSLSPPERAALAKVLIESLEGDRRSDEEIKAELTSRLAELRSGEDPGLTFAEVFRAHVEIEAPLKTRGDQRLIDEVLVSGPGEPLTKAKMDKIRDRILRPKKS